MSQSILGEVNLHSTLSYNGLLYILFIYMVFKRFLQDDLSIPLPWQENNMYNIISIADFSFFISIFLTQAVRMK